MISTHIGMGLRFPMQHRRSSLSAEKKQIIVSINININTASKCSRGCEQVVGAKEYASMY